MSGDADVHRCWRYVGLMEGTMNRIVIIDQPVASVRLSQTQVGDIVVVTDGLWKDTIILVGTDYQYVAVNDPTMILNSNINVRVLPKGTKIEFTIGVALSPADEVLVRDLYQSGRKIDAIKHVRTVTALGLKEAKDLADQIGGSRG